MKEALKELCHKKRAIIEDIMSQKRISAMMDTERRRKLSRNFKDRNDDSLEKELARIVKDEERKKKKGNEFTNFTVYNTPIKRRVVTKSTDNAFKIERAASTDRKRKKRRNLMSADRKEQAVTERNSVILSENVQMTLTNWKRVKHKKSCFDSGVFDLPLISFVRSINK